VNSQIIQVAIGVVAAFFFVALISSGVVEVIAKVLRKRANDLEATLKQLLGGDDVVAAMKGTSVYQALRGGSSGSSSANPDALDDKVKPSYMPARSFADATIEMLATAKAGVDQASGVIAQVADSPLGKRLKAIESEVGGDLTAAKANLETWFDASMQRLQGAYTRWAKFLLGVVGLIIAVGLNISATTLVNKLWTDPVAREAAVAAVGSNATTSAQSAPSTPSDPKAVADQVKNLDALQLPIGWGMPAPDSFGAWVVVAVGWIITGFAAMVGAPYWFDLLRRLTSFAGVSPGGKPLPAAQDAQSSVSAMATSNSAPTVVTPAAAATGTSTAAVPGATPAVPVPATPDVFGTTFIPQIVS
jgi:hypothetical protein